MQSLPVLATMVVGIGIFVLAVHTIGQRPAAVRTFYQPGKYLCCAVLLPSAPVANLLLYLTEHRNFPKLIDLIRIYFQDTAAKGITARNQLIEMATASLSDLMKEHPEHRAEAKQDLQLLNAQKIGEHEAEIEKIKNVFLAILRDIKKDIDNGEQPGEAVTAAMFQAMRDALAEQKQKPLSIDDVTAMIAGQIGQLTPMDKETVEMFQQFAKKMIEQAGTK